MYKETCLLPTESENGVNEERPSATSYSFVTECFFMAHRTLDLGFRVAVDKLIKLNHVNTISDHCIAMLLNYLFPGDGTYGKNVQRSRCWWK